MRPKTDARNRIDLKLPPEKRLRWERAAESEALTLSEWIRRVCDAAVKRRGGSTPDIARKRRQRLANAIDRAVESEDPNV